MLGQPVSENQSVSSTAYSKKNTTVVLLILPTLIVVAATVASMNLRIPTFIQVDLTTNRLEFTTSRDKGVQYLTTELKPKWLTLQQYAKIAFGPKDLQFADPSKYKEETDTYSEDAWVSAEEVGKTVTFSAISSKDVDFTLEAPSKAIPVIGTLDSIQVASNTSVLMSVTPGPKTTGEQDPDMAEDTPTSGL
jgi:hypothetical protein